MASRRVCLLALTLALAASSSFGCGPALPEYRLVPAAGGGAIKLEQREEIRLPDGSRALRLQYRSDLDLDDTERLRAEVEEVWRTFRSEADALGIGTVLIEARTLRGDRWSRIGHAQRFAYQKEGGDGGGGDSGGGSWRFVEGQPPRTTAVKPL